ncbi:MAG: PAS domain-containing protein, partial [Betaproteobacteria bacterium]
MHATIQMALERYKFEGALAESEERLSRALAASNVALWDLDIASNNLYLSAQWSEMLGGEAKPVITTFEELARLTHPEDREKLLALAVAAQSGSIPTYEFDHRVITGSGEWIWVHSRGRVVERNHSGNALRITGTNTDITERKRAEERIRYLATRDALTEL